MIAVIGNFGYQTKKLDGQTIKTRQVYRLVKEQDSSAVYYDRQQAMVSKLSLLRMFRYVARSSKVLYLPAYGHLKYAFPLIWLVAKLCRTEIHYIVIGGWLASFIKNLPLHRFMLRRIDKIFCETQIQKKELVDWYGLENTEVMHNFRNISFKPTEHHTQGQLKLVFVARITIAKGLKMIFALGEFLVAQGLDHKVTIDFYGQIAPDDELYFMENLKKYHFINYRGVLQPDEVHTTMQHYDATLFPTNYAGEGLPGTLIDSYIAGIPIIATDWKYAHEFIKDGKTGIIVPYIDGQEQFNKAVVTLLNDEAMLSQMKRNAAKACDDFSDAKAREIIRKILAS